MVIDDLKFTFTYIVDQLIYYGTKEYSGESYFQLACLLFCVLFQDEAFSTIAPKRLKSNSDNDDVWPSALLMYAKGLSYFLSFFPISNLSLETLRALHQQFILK